MANLIKLQGNTKVYPLPSGHSLPDVSWWKTLLCGLFGHDFNGCGTVTDSQTGELKERFTDCDRCRMTYHEVVVRES